MTIRKVLLAGVATAVVSVAMTVLSATSAMATSPFGTYPVCDGETPQLCLSANGTANDLVYSKTLDTLANEQKTTVATANVCDSTDVVNYNGTNCPFTNSTFDKNYSGDLIIQLYNTHENNMWYRGDSFYMYQGAKGSGYEYVLAPAGGGFYYVINVNATDTADAEQHVCSEGANLAIVVQNNWAGAGACEWQMP